MIISPGTALGGKSLLLKTDFSPLHQGPTTHAARPQPCRGFQEHPSVLTDLLSHRKLHYEEVLTCLYVVIESAPNNACILAIAPQAPYETKSGLGTDHMESEHLESQPMIISICMHHHAIPSPLQTSMSCSRLTLVHVFYTPPLYRCLSSLTLFVSEIASQALLVEHN